jgi:hypothetical protein
MRDLMPMNGFAFESLETVVISAILKEIDPLRSTQITNDFICSADLRILFRTLLRLSAIETLRTSHIYRVVKAENSMGLHLLRVDWKQYGLHERFWTSNRTEIVMYFLKSVIFIAERDFGNRALTDAIKSREFFLRMTLNFGESDDLHSLQNLHHGLLISSAI